MTAVSWFTAGHQPGLIIATSTQSYTNKGSVRSIGRILASCHFLLLAYAPELLQSVIKCLHKLFMYFVSIWAKKWGRCIHTLDCGGVYPPCPIQRQSHCERWCSCSRRSIIPMEWEYLDIWGFSLCKTKRVFKVFLFSLLMWNDSGFESLHLLKLSTNLFSFLGAFSTRSRLLTFVEILLNDCVFVASRSNAWEPYVCLVNTKQFPIRSQMTDRAAAAELSSDFKLRAAVKPHFWMSISEDRAVNSLLSKASAASVPWAT